jgi:opacity protein-like surface antigen
VSPYLTGGIGLAFSDPDVTYGQPDSPDAGIDYHKLSIALPMGGGVKFDASEKVVLGLELGIRFTFSDYLDGTQASGNAYKNDSYTFVGVWGAYRFSKPAEEVPTPSFN